MCCIRTVLENDIKSIARLHKEVFTDHFLGKLPVKSDIAIYFKKKCTFAPF